MRTGKLLTRFKDCDAKLLRALRGNYTMTSCGRYDEYLPGEAQSQNDTALRYESYVCRQTTHRRFKCVIDDSTSSKTLRRMRASCIVWRHCPLDPSPRDLRQRHAPLKSGSMAASRLRCDMMQDCDIGTKKVCLQLVVEPYERLSCSPASSGDVCGEDPCREAIDIISMSVSNHSILLCGGAPGGGRVAVPRNCLFATRKIWHWEFCTVVSSYCLALAKVGQARI